MMRPIVFWLRGCTGVEANGLRASSFNTPKTTSSCTSSSAKVVHTVDMSVVAIDPPPSLRWSILFFLLWPFLAARLARRGADTRLLMALPVAFGLVILALDMARIANVMSLAGPAPHAVAAGLAEAVVAVVIGALSALVVLGIIALKRILRISSAHPAASLCLLAAALIAETAIGTYIRHLPAFSRQAFTITVVGLALALASCFGIAWAIARSTLRASISRFTTRWCVGSAVVAFLLAIIASTVVHNLAQFAIGGA